MLNIIKLLDNSQSIELENPSLNLLDELLADKRNKLWVDLTSEDADLVRELLNKFKVDPLVIDDTLRKSHPSKIEFFDEHLFILYRGIRAIEDHISFEHQSITLIVTENVIVSVHPVKSIGVEQSRKTLQKLKHLSPLSIAIQIMKTASSVYLEKLINFDSELSNIEELLEMNANDQLLKELTKFKSRLVKLTRTFNYQTDISEGLQKETDNYPYFDKEACEHAINDLDDRFHRLFTLSQMHYDICGDLIDGYLSISAHQLNETMRVLTVITAIFVPLGFLAGLYGMNFEYIPELKVANGYFYLIGVMLLISGSLIYFFKKNRWL